SELPEPPDSWTWTTIGKVISDTPQNGLYRPRTDYGSGTPIVRIDDFQDDFVRPRSDLLKLRVPHEEARKFAIHPGDVLINRVNSPSHIGKCLLVQPELCPAVFESNMMKIHTLAEVDPRWVVAYLRCGDGRKRLTASAKWAVNQVSINQTDVCSTPIS